jgi:formylglycine-generating enzyme required for sulfatase activity
MAVALGLALLIAVAVLVKLLLTPGHPPKPQPPRLAPTLSTPSGEMVLVPAGKFLYGRDKVPATLSDFYIDKTEVTNAAYESFCKERKYPQPAGFQADKPDYPVVNVTIADAREFARWAGKRLPTAQEWEKAARGDKGWLFPWGEDRDPRRANVRDNDSLGKHEVMRADSFLPGASPYGALNMVGNVWEFVDETVKPLPENMAYFSKRLHPPPGPEELWYETRGESFENDLATEDYGGLWEEWVAPARWKSPIIGFRCVKDAPPAH